MDTRRKISKFTPFDRVLDGLEQEDLIEDDLNTKIIKVYNKKRNQKMFLLEKLISNEKEHLKYIDEIHKYESIQVEGILTIDKWTYDMMIDQHLNKAYKFILVFDTYTQNLQQYMESVSVLFINIFKQNKKLQLLKEDIVILFRLIIQSLLYLQERQQVILNPICPQTIVLCSDTNAKYNCIPLLMTNYSLNKAKIEALLYLPPELKQQNQPKNTQQTFNQMVYSFGLIFIQIFLMKSIDVSKIEIIRLNLKEIQLKYGDTYKTYIEAMLEQDPNKRIKFNELAQLISHSEPQKMIANNNKITFSEIFEFYRKSYEVQGDGQAKAIAVALPWTRQVILSNLFNIKNYFLELIDLSITTLISEKAVTLIFENFRVIIVGGGNSKFIYELEDEMPTLIQKATFPNCTTNRWGFGSVICTKLIINREKNSLFICSGYVDQQLCNHTHKIDLQTFKWTQLSNCHKPGEGCTLVLFNELIFKYGGMNETGKPLNIIEKYDGNHWRTVNFRIPNYQLPSYSLAVQVNPAQIFIFGGDTQNQQGKVLVMNIDQSAHIIEKKEDILYLEFSVNEFMNYGKFGMVEQIQISNNNIFLLQKKDEKNQYLTLYDPQQGFVEVRKMHV